MRAKKKVAPNLSQYFEALEEYVVHSEERYRQSAALPGSHTSLFGIFSGPSLEDVEDAKMPQQAISVQALTVQAIPKQAMTIQTIAIQAISIQAITI